MKRTAIIVNSTEQNMRLDVFLVDKIEEKNRSQWQKVIKDGLVAVNSKIASPNHRLREGDKVEVKNELSKEKKIIKANKETKDKSLLKKIKVLAETADYLVVDKPAGLVVHEDAVHKDYTLAHWLLQKYPKIKKVGDSPMRPGIVHRLDKDVSGLLVIAKTQDMFDNLKKQFKTREIKKEYQALVYNKMEQEDGEIKLSIVRSKNKGMFIAKIQEDENAKSAITKYEVLKKYQKFTLLKILILTGRTHQIRVHLQSIGHTIVGDDLYKTKDLRLKPRKLRVDLKRIWLCAKSLGFYDLQNKWQEFEIKRPKELEDFLGTIK